MLRVLDASSAPSSAYRVPWSIRRGSPDHPRVFNDSGRRLDNVRIFVDDPDERRTHYWGHVLPGEHVELCLCATKVDDVVVTLAWFRNETGEEYCWRFVV